MALTINNLKNTASELFKAQQSYQQATTPTTTSTTTPITTSIPKTMISGTGSAVAGTPQIAQTPQVVQQQPQFMPTNNTAYIEQQNSQILQSTVAAIKAAVQQAKAKQQTIINKAPEEYGNLKNVVFNQSLAGLPSMNENVANLGASSSGGFSRTEQGKAESGLQNRLGELDRQKQSVIDQANSEIANLESQGMIDEANATKEIALSKLQQIVAESARLDAINQEQFQFSKNFALNEADLTGTYNGQQTMQGQNNASNLEQQKIANFVSTIGQYPDIQAQINKVTNDNDPSNDWQLPYLQSARQDKLGIQASAQYEQQVKSYDDAMKRWTTSGYVSSQDAEILGIAAGTPTSDAKFKEANLQLDQLKTQYDVNKPYYKATGGTSSSSLFKDKDFFTYASQMLNETVKKKTGEDLSGNPIYTEVPKYTDQDVVNYVVGQGLDSNTTASILNALNVQSGGSSQGTSILSRLFGK